MSFLSAQLQKKLSSSTISGGFSTSGSVTALFGPSGAGKTTIINMLSGLELPDHGKITLNGDTLFDSDLGIDVSPHKRRIGYVFQEDRLFPHKKVLGNLKYGMSRSDQDKEIISLDAVIDLLGIENLLERSPLTLSGGEKQRVAIGRALLSNPRLMLMDEPLASLDAGRRKEIIPFLDRVRHEFDIPIVYVTHNIQEILHLADTLVVIGDGRIRGVGSVEEILSKKSLRQWTGIHDAGTVFVAKVEDNDTEGLTTLAFEGGKLKVPDGPPKGSSVRVRVPALNVSISLEKPKQISVLNIFQGTIINVEQDDKQVDIQIDVGIPLWARITAHSAARLNLKSGVRAYALIKAVSVDRERHGQGVS